MAQSNREADGDVSSSVAFTVDDHIRAITFQSALRQTKGHETFKQQFAIQRLMGNCALVVRDLMSVTVSAGVGEDTLMMIILVMSVR